jgi:lysozyme
MTTSDYASLRQMIGIDEGCRLQPYADTVGKLTVGYGHNLTDRGISQRVADLLRDDDIDLAVRDLLRAFPIVLSLNGPRQVVLVSMCFNMGIERLKGFVKMWLAIESSNYAQAAVEMLDSEWAQQVGARARRLAETMHSGDLTMTYVPLWAKGAL